MEKKRTLKERIDRIIHAGEIELAGEVYKGKYELNNVKSIKNFILDKLRLNEKGKNKVYINVDTGKKISISGNSAGKLTSHYKYGETYQKTIAHLQRIIENMKFLEEMSPDKENSKFGNYSYYITRANIDGESYTILSTVGHNEYGIYYDQNVFEGTPKEVFKEAKTSNDNKYSRLKEILKEEAADPSELHSGDKSQPASTNKYTKISPDVQGEPPPKGLRFAAIVN
ncbi:MAG: hypothetical protein LBC64_00535 [Fibromonadaceae bacterium]|jgi:hypothetical protein|nr:hypothetical protein [Fibromonadaceae bacterium]